MFSRAQLEAHAGQEKFSRAQWESALDHFNEAIRLEPDNADFYYAAAMCDWAAGKMDSAGAYLQTAVRVNPAHAVAQSWLGEWYLSQGIVDAALGATGAAMDLAPNESAIMQSRAWVLEAAGEADAAWAIVSKLIARTEMTPSLARLYGRLADQYGQREEALAVINQLLGAGLAPGESSLHYTAAQLLDRAGRYDEAFCAAVKANVSYRGTPYDPASQTRWTDRLIEYFTRERLFSLPKATYRSDKPVFIVGMPRSGTSLIEQILASHPSVHGAGELDFVYRTVLGTLDMLRASFDEYPSCIDNLSVAHADGMAHFYLGPFVALKPDAARITDKMPLNFLHLGLISLLFPDARIIHCRRDPMDTCLSCFLTHFNQGHEFKHNLAHLGHFYRLYERLMAHWKSVISLPILDVSYEEMIGDPETQSRRMVEFLGLPWDERCLNFHDTQRACVTASVLQVRRPIYHSSVQRWRKYERHLGPLKAALWGN